MADKPSVLHVMRPAGGGLLTWVKEVTSEQRRSGIRVGVAGPSILQSAFPNIPFHVVEITDRPHLVDDLKAARMLHQAAKQYDLVHAHGTRALMVCSAINSGRLVASLHNLPPQPVPWMQRLLLLHFIGRASWLLPVSEGAKRMWQCVLRDGNYHVVPGGVRPAEQAPDNRDPTRRWLGVGERDILALYAGRLMHDKGIDLLIEAVAALPAVRLVVAGSGPMEAELQERAQALRAAVQFIGPVNSPWPLLAAADLAICPSRREGQGLFAMEALAMGVPVVATESGGLPETVRDGETGWLCAPDDTDALIGALARAVADRDRWSEMGERGREAAKSWTWERTVALLNDVYARMKPYVCSRK